MSVYTGSNNGFMQAAYVDQQGTALPGDLAYASDVDLIDACVVSMPAGSEGDLLPVGVGVVGAYSADASRPGMTSVKVSPVGADTTAAQLYGVTVRNQQCRTDENNVSGWGDGDVCNVMRTARVGGRIWVTAGNAATANTAAHLVVTVCPSVRSWALKSRAIPSPSPTSSGSPLPPPAALAFSKSSR